MTDDTTVADASGQGPALRRAMSTIKKLRGQLAEQTAVEPIAMIGAGIRAPGGIHSLDGYWQALESGQNLVSRMPDSRLAPFEREWAGLPTRGSYFDDVLGFDPGFFGISPREAEAIDPQHRMLLEVVWEALEDGGAAPESFEGATVGTFVGITGSQDYGDWAGDTTNAHWSTGVGHSFAAGRIAYTFGFTGPAVAVDTACSSSLVALHHAVAALRSRQCDAAVVAAVNLVLSPRSTRLISATRSLAPDGFCKTFDARANGYVRGEGCGAVVLKRLSDALRDHDRILGVIHGSAINQDGRSTGFTAPNVLAQTRLLQAALADARCTAADVGLVEAHGTGTSLGDPIEMSAIVTALGQPNGGRPLHVGSAKTNLGHLEAASGVIGLLKALLCVRHRRIPPLVHFRNLNPRIDLTGTDIRVSGTASAWDLTTCGPLAGVSAFGLIGTNAHVIIGPAPEPEVPADTTSPDVRGFVLSARSPAALRGLAGTLADRLDGLDAADYPAVAYTMGTGRRRHPYAVWIDGDTPARAAVSLHRVADPAQSLPDTPLADTPAADGAGLPRRVVTLPTTPWQRIRCAPDVASVLHQPQPVPVSETETVTDGSPNARTGTATRPDTAPGTRSSGLMTTRWVEAGTDDADVPSRLLLVGDDAQSLASLAAHAHARGAVGHVMTDRPVDVPQGWTRAPRPRDAAAWRRALAEALPGLPADGAAGTDGAAPRLVLVPAPTDLPDTLDPAHDPVPAAAQACADVTLAVRQWQEAVGAGRVLVVTRAARAAVPGDRVLAGTHGALHGLAGTIGMEYPTCWGGVLDLPATSTGPDDAAAVRHLLFGGSPSGSGEDVVAVRDGRLLAPRLTPADAAFTPDLPIHGEATYLVTGAGGGVGTAIVDDLVRRGARHLLLVGRRPFEALRPAARAAIDGHRADGVEVHYRQADCHDPQALSAVWDGVSPEHPVRGIVHAAGTLPAGRLADADADHFAEGLRGKYGGAVWLHLLSTRGEIDFFVLTSSASAAWGHEGRGSYTAANGASDAVAAQRKALGLPALSIAFGAWDLEGMADKEGRAGLTRVGVLGMSAEQGCAALSAAGPAGDAWLMACPLDQQRFTTVMDQIRRRPLFDLLRPGRPDQDRAASGHGVLTGVPLARRAEVTRAHVRAHLARTLGHSDPDVLDAGTGFYDLGLDSIMAVDLARELGLAFGTRVKVADIFDHPTLDRLGSRMVNLVDGTAPGSSTGASTGPSTGPSAPSWRVTGARGPASAPGEPAPLVTPIADPASGPVAIVGMAGRFPGAPDVAQLWQLLLDGVDAVGPVPADRWDGAALRGSEPGTVTTDQGGFLDDVDAFDPAFFGIPWREAESMDPQHRLLLQCAWHALEDGGVDPRGLAGSATGVFVGITNSDYARLLEGSGLAGLDAYFGSGTALNVAAGRIAFLLGLTGPALAVDTACSSSLVALHLAVRSLRSGECTHALVGGVNVIASPACSVAVSRAHMLSPDGRCKTFSASADGFVRSEGAGMLLLKPLEAARRDGDQILAVIHGTAVNQDGASSGLTVPNGAAQRAVIEAAWREAGVDRADVTYLEAHGTGTALGDPIEVGAAWDAFAAPGRRRAPLMVGSVKSNLGHSESASGVVGVIKTVLALRNRRIPPSLHAENLNPHIDWDGMDVRVVRSATDWTPHHGRRFAGVSSFGFSGTNAHVALGEAPADAPVPPDGTTGAGPSEPILLTLSAPDEASYERVRAAWEGPVLAADDDALRGLAVTAARGRAHHPVRRVILAPDADVLRQEWAAGEPVRIPSHVPRVGFMFPGAGSQYPGMGRELYDGEPVFRAVVDECADHLTPLLGADVRDVLYDNAHHDVLDRIEFTQSGTVVLGLALAELWRSYGVVPTVVTGHSVGEIAAAVVAGVLDLPSGLRLVAHRARLMASTAPGAMLSLAAPLHQVEQWLDGSWCDVAAVNGPASVVVAGDPRSVEEVAERARADGAKARVMAVSMAAHSRLTDPVLREFGQVCRSFTFHEPRIAIVSNLTGELAAPGTYTPDYWPGHMRGTVQFHAGLRAFTAAGVDVAVELGPDQTLVNLMGGADLVPAGGAVPSLVRGTGERATLLAAVARLHELGQDVDFTRVYPAPGHRAVPAPPYPFARERIWTSAARRGQEPRTARTAPAVEQHWGEEVTSPALAGRMIRFGRTATFPAHLADHRIEGTVLVPASSHLSTIMSALGGLDRPLVLEDLVFPEPLVIADGERYQGQLLVSDGERPVVRVVSAPDGPTPIRWREHLRGILAAGPPADHTPAVVPEPQDFIATADRVVEGEGFYAAARTLGYTLGPSFRWISRLWIRGDEALVRFDPPPVPDRVEDFEIYPGLVDSCFQTVAAFMMGDTPLQPGQGLAIPFSVRRLLVGRRPVPGEPLWGRVRAGERRSRPDGRSQVVTADMQLWQDPAAPVLVVDDLRVREAERVRLRRNGPVPTVLVPTWRDRAELAAVRTDAGSTDAGRPLVVQLIGVEHPAGRRLRTGLQLAGHVLLDGDEEATVLGLRPDLVLDARLLAAASDPAPAQVGEVEHVAAACAALTRSLAEHPDRVPYLTVLPDVPAALPLLAAVEGALACVRAERPDSRVALLAVDPDGDPVQPVALIGGEAAAGLPEPTLVLRAGQVRVRRMEPAAEPTAPLRPSPGVTLITGAFGGLGTALAARLVAAGTRHLVVSGRHAPGREAAAVIEELRAAGATVDVVVADVTDAAQVAALVERAAGHGPLGDVYHLAGALADRPLSQLTPQDLRVTFAAKCGGAQLLAASCAEHGAARVVLFSSAAAVLGSPGQAAYGAANGFLAGLAARLQAEGTAATAVAWGPWVPGTGTGMAAGSAVLRQADRLGIGVLTDDDATALLGAVITADEPVAVALSLDLPRFVADPHTPGAWMLDGTLGTAATTAAATPAPAPTHGDDAPAGGTPGHLRRELATLQAVDRRPRLRAAIRAQMARALGEDPAWLVPDDTLGFEDMGLDSIMMIDIGAALGKDLALDLPSTVAMDHPSVLALTDHLLDVLVLDPVPEAPPRPRAGDGPDAPPPAHLSDEELLRAIADDLAKDV